MNLLYFITFCLTIFLVSEVESQLTMFPRDQPIIFPTSLSKQCCGLISNPQALLDCTNNTAVQNNKKFMAEKKIALVKYSTNNIAEYTSYSMAINSAFAEINHYGMILLTPNDGAEYEKSDQRWNKVKIIENALHPVTGWARDLQYVVWLDSDLIILDMGMLLEEIASNFSEYDMIFSSDPRLENGVVNSGMFFVKNTEWSRKFLNDWWQTYDRNTGMDQHVFTKLYDQNKPEMSKHIAILRSDAINTNFPSWENQQPHNQVLHLAGVSNIMRKEIFKTAFQTFCNSVNSVNKVISDNDSNADGSNKIIVLPRQLGLTKDVQKRIENEIPRGQVIFTLLEEMKSKANKSLSIADVQHVSSTVMLPSFVLSCCLLPSLHHSCILYSSISI